MVREVTALEQARGPVDTARVASLKADINKLSNALCELIAQPQGTPSRHVDPVVRQSLDDAKAALNNGNGVAHAKPSGPSPTVTPPEDPVEAGAARVESELSALRDGLVRQPAVLRVYVAADLARMTSGAAADAGPYTCLLYTSPSPRDGLLSRMPSSA